MCRVREGILLAVHGPDLITEMSMADSLITLETSGICLSSGPKRSNEEQMKDPEFKTQMQNFSI